MTNAISRVNKSALKADIGLTSDAMSECRAFGEMEWNERAETFEVERLMYPREGVGSWLLDLSP